MNISFNNSTLTNNTDLFCPANLPEYKSSDEQINHPISTFSDMYRNYMWLDSCSSGDIGTCMSSIATKINTDTMLAFAASPRQELSYKLHKMAAETFLEIKNIALYCGVLKTLNFDFARQSPIEALRAERGSPSPRGRPTRRLDWTKSQPVKIQSFKHTAV